MRVGDPRAAGWPPASVWPALLLTGGIATAAAFFIQTYVQQRLSAVETGMIILTEPIFAAIFGQLLMGDQLNGLQILGAVLMVAAVFATEIVPLFRGTRLMKHSRNSESPVERRSCSHRSFNRVGNAPRVGKHAGECCPRGPLGTRLNEPMPNRSDHLPAAASTSSISFRGAPMSST